MDITTAPDLGLDTRTGWPSELRVLLRKFPRATWPDHVNLGQLARFWLSIHDGFRSYGRKLGEATIDLREGKVPPERFRSWFAPRLDMFLSHLNGHHQIEDHQYFPLFAAAEPRLKRGFDILENDHTVIHAAMDQAADSAAGFLRLASGDADKLRFAGDAYAATNDRLLRLLTRHLDDEEDLIIPLILERGESDLGI